MIPTGDITTKLLLVEFKSLQPEKDPLVGWLRDLGFWDTTIVRRVFEARKHLPLDIETQFREAFGLPLNENARTLFEILLKDMNGIEVETLGPLGWTSTGVLSRLKLFRVDKALIKPLCQVPLLVHTLSASF